MFVSVLCLCGKEQASTWILMSCQPFKRCRNEMHLLKLHVNPVASQVSKIKSIQTYDKTCITPTKAELQHTYK